MNASHNYPDALQDVVRALLRDDRQAADAHMATLAQEPPTIVVRRPLSVPILAEIYERDRYQCRYCGARTVLIPVMRLISTVYPREFPYHQNWKAGHVHPAVAIISATHDHVNPLKPLTGGGDALALDNVVTACWVCNSAKGNLAIDALGWTLHDPTDDHWHGLADVYPSLWDRLGCPTVGSNERAWLKATRALYAPR